MRNRPLAVPRTDTANAVAELLRTVAPRYLINHNYRTFAFGTLLVTTELNDDDSETAFVASLFHDLSLLDGFRGDRSFELVGAEHAARYLEQRQWERSRIALVESAIIRHVELAPSDNPIERVVQAGAALDVAGVPLEAVELEAVVEIIRTHPRDGFVESIIAAVRDEVRAQPEGVFSRLETHIALTSLIANNPLCRHD
jgi:hypothetical protein